MQKAFTHIYTFATIPFHSLVLAWSSEGCNSVLNYTQTYFLLHIC